MLSQILSLQGALGGGTAVIDPPVVAVTSVSIAPTTASISVGNVQQLTETILPANASDKSGTWSSNSANATVDSNGLVTAVTEGIATITFTTIDGGFTDSTEITITAVFVEELYTVANVLSTTNEANSLTGITAQNSTVANIATTPAPIDGTYLLRIDTATGNAFTSVPTTVGVTYEITYWAWAEASSAGYVNAWGGDGFVFQSWTTTPTQYTQIITATGTSQLMRFYLSSGTEVYVDAISVKEEQIAVTGVTVTPPTASVGVGATTSLTRTIAPVDATNQNGTWSSSDESLATVNATGLVTGVALGDVVITYTTQEGGFTDTTAVNISGTITASLLAFPEAEGFGAQTVGGRGGTTIYVTNLNDSGAGSLREACEASGARTVLFKVGGLITLNSTINITNPNISILGQSAPGDGIAITAGMASGALINVGASEVIIRYIKMRRDTTLTYDSSADSLYISSGQNIVIDHCSMAFANDENLGITKYSVTPTQNITIQYCIISNPYGGSGKGSLCARDINYITFYRNAFLSNTTRNPYMSPQQDNPDFDTFFEIVNNVIYNGKYYIEVTRDDSYLPVEEQGTSLGAPSYNVINNYARLSTDTDPFQKNAERQMILSYGVDPLKIYAKGNIHPLRPTITNDVDYTSYTSADWAEEWATTQGADGFTNINVEANASRQAFVPISTPIIDDNVTIYNAVDVWNNIRTHVGASYPSRDSHDVQMVNETDTQTRTDSYASNALPIYNNASNNTPSYIDTNNDGIDNSWFTANVPNGDTAISTNVTGYTYLEVYQNSLYN